MNKKLYEVIQRYSDIIAFEIPSLKNMDSSIEIQKNTHLGFNIIDNSIVNVKYYFTSNVNVPENYLQLSVPRQEYSMSFTDDVPSLRWNCRPDFEPAPYIEHRNILHFLLDKIQLQNEEDRYLRIADEIQRNTKSERYPLVGYGLSHDVQNYQKITDIKLYYTFWVIKNWNDEYGRNYSDISKKALKAIEPEIENNLFKSNYLSITDMMLKYDNLISGFACNIGKSETSYKIYFITKDQTWLESANAMHEILFAKPLYSRFMELFNDIRSLGYRYEEIVYVVSGNRQGIKLYFMV